MESVLKIVYNYSINSKILDIKSIDKIIELLININELNFYISNMQLTQENNKKLASYCNYTKTIIINCNTIEYMLKNIEENLLISKYFEKIFYKNIAILQVILHELEHAYQEKIIYTENSLEAFLLRISLHVNNEFREKLYDICIEERLAEINSFEKINSMIYPLHSDLPELYDALQIDKLQRLLRGYHYISGEFIESPLINYMKKTNNSIILNVFDWYNNDQKMCLDSVSAKYKIGDRYKYGFPVELEEYAVSMKKLLLSSNRRFKNKILIQ